MNYELGTLNAPRETVIELGTLPKSFHRPFNPQALNFQRNGSKGKLNQFKRKVELIQKSA